MEKVLSTVLAAPVTVALAPASQPKPRRKLLLLRRNPLSSEKQKSRIITMRLYVSVA
jgi:hypothetical protein